MSTRERHHEPRIAIAMGRKYRGQTQGDLAKALTEKTGEPWSRGMVGHLESGYKNLTVEVLMAIAEIQDLPYDFYLEGPSANRAKGVSRGSILALAPA